MERSQSQTTNLPNYLSILRLTFIPLVVICLYFSGRTGSFLAALFLGLAALTDLLDGFYARRYRVVTTLGKFLDPLADKLLVSVTMIMLITLHRIPAWVVMVIIARELTVTGLRSIAAVEGQVIAAIPLGKYKFIFQSVALICLCLHYEYVQINFHAVGMIFLWVALVLTLWSGWRYFPITKKFLS
jgi:CDP-diacylglycerol--glycerol-3-phosphate 3-phosphatidyltransferase